MTKYFFVVSVPISHEDDGMCRQTIYIEGHSPILMWSDIVGLVGNLNRRMKLTLTQMSVKPGVWSKVLTSLTRAEHGVDMVHETCMSVNTFTTIPGCQYDTVGRLREGSPIRFPITISRLYFNKL